jgi:hypothetical protein
MFIFRIKFLVLCITSLRRIYFSVTSELRTCAIEQVEKRVYIVAYMRVRSLYSVPLVGSSVPVPTSSAREGLPSGPRVSEIPWPGSSAGGQRAFRGGGRLSSQPAQNPSHTSMTNDN